MIPFSAVLVACLFGFSARSFAQGDPAYARQILKENGKTIYVVGQRAPHLFMISRDLYGNEKNWKKIANWNGVKPPYDLKFGQRLNLREEPKISEAEANRILYQEWNMLGEIEKARRILVQSSEGVSAEAQQEILVGTQVVPSVPPPAEYEAPAVVLEKQTEASHLEAKPPVVMAPVTRPLPPPLEQVAPKESNQKVLKNAQSVEPADHDQGHSPWHWVTKVTATQTEVTYKHVAADARHNLKTSVDPGIELEAEWKFGAKSYLFGILGYETFEVHGGHGVTVEPEKLDILKVALGYGAHLGSRMDLMISLGSEKMVFAEMVSSGLEMATTNVIQMVLGSRLLIYDGSSSRIHGLLNLISLQPSKVFHEDLAAGFGASLGIQVSYDSFLYGLSARVAEQNSSDLKSQQTNGSFYLGWAW